MKGTTLARTLLGLAVVIIVGATALAQDSRSTTITINGGRTTVQMKAPSKIEHHNSKPPACVGFYDNICGGGYQAGIGWTISDGSPINTEYTPGNEIVSLKSGTTSRIKVGVGFVQGTNGGIVILDKDCSGVPCGKIDATHLCKGNIHNLPTFGQSSTQTESIKCVATLKKGKSYWVYVQSDANSWLAWNFSNTATGGLIEGTNDVWGTSSGGNSVGALTIK